MQNHTSVVFALNPYNMHLLDTLCYDNIDEHHCCFWVPPVLCDMLRLQAPDKGTCVDYSMMRPGHYYYLECLDHHVSIIYLELEIIFYVDYYQETGREFPFRIEQITVAELNRFLQSVTDANLDEYVKFHKGDSALRDHLESQANYIQPGSLIECVYEQPLQPNDIDLADLRRVIEGTDPSFPMSDFDLGGRDSYIKIDFEDRLPEDLIHANQRYDSYFEKFRMLLNEMSL